MRLLCGIKTKLFFLKRDDGTIRLPSPALAAAVVSVIIMSWALLLPPIIGMADNGDFYRTANGQGIYKLDRYEADQYLSYFSHQYGVYEYFNEYESSIFTTQLPFIQAAKLLDSVVTRDAYFDIRFMSGLFILYAAVSIYLLVSYATYRISGAAGYWIAALAVVMFADTGYAAYFNSFYAEGLVLISFLCTASAALLLTQRRYSPYVLLAVMTLNGLILTGTKQQNAPVGILLGLLCAVLLFVLRRKKKDPTEGEIKSPRLFGLCAVAASILLCMGGIAVYALIPQEFVTINQYHAMTRGVLMTSPNPEQALEEFGLNRQYALLNNSIYYERYPAIDVENPMLFDDFYSRYGFVPVVSYYIRHPGQLLQMIDIAAREAYAIRPESIGNFERSYGAAPGARTSFFTLHSTIKLTAIPKTVGFILVWAALAGVICHKDAGKLAVVLFTILIGLSQIGVSIIGAGDADLAKHVFLYNVTFDFVNFICGAVLIYHIHGWLAKQVRASLEKRRKRTPARG